MKEAISAKCRKGRMWFVAAAGRDPLVPMALAALAGVAIADRLPVFWLLPGAGIFAMGCFALAWLRPQLPGALVLGALAVYGLAHAVTLWSAGQFPFLLNLKNGESIRLEAMGLVVEEPAEPGVDATGPRNGRCTIRFSQFHVAGHTVYCDQRLPVRLRGVNATLRYGDRIFTSGLLQPFSPPPSPGAFDPKAFFFRAMGAPGEFAIGAGDRIEIVGRNEGHAVMAWAVRSRGWIEAAITRGLRDSPDDVAVIKAMTLGSREGTPEHIEEAYRLSGAMHVFSVSGLHVAIFAAVLWWVLRLFRVPRRFAMAVLIPAIVFYAFVTGLPPSAVRAAVMGTVVFFAYLVERKPRLLNSLGLSFLVVLAFDTQQLFRPGFQLSFAVLAAIGLFAESLKAAIHWPWRLDPFVPRRLVPRWLRTADWLALKLSESLGVSIAAWAGSALLIVYHFQMITPIAVVANVFMVPASFFVLATAIVSLLISLVGLGVLCEWVINPLNGLFARILTAMAGFFANAPGSFLHVPGDALAGSLPPDSTRLVVCEPNIGGMTALLSVRPSDSAPVHWLIDPGDPPGYSSAGQPLLRQAGVNRIQTLVITHGDFDHIGAAPALIGRFRPRVVMDGPFDSRSATYPKILESIAKTGAGHLRAASGDRVAIAGPASVQVLYPSRLMQSPSLADDRCLVLLLRHHDWRILFSADSGFSTEKWLLEHEPRAIRADVWIKGWHGSDSSGLTEFLDQVKPDAVITTNHDFPEREKISDEWRKELAARRAELFDISAIGAVSIEISRERLRIVNQAGGGPVFELRK